MCVSTMDSTWTASSIISTVSSSFFAVLEDEERQRSTDADNGMVFDHHHHHHQWNDGEDAYVPSAPAWMVEFVSFRRRLFLRTVEPIIVAMLGPGLLPENEEGTTRAGAGEVESASSYATTTSLLYFNDSSFDNETTITAIASMHRKLGFLPDYVENAASFRDTSMSFATLITLFVTMTCILLIFLSCFYHNQKTSPLFISPRRHRLPKLVPPPLPEEGYFDWVRCFVFQKGVCVCVFVLAVVGWVAFDAGI